MGRKRSRGWHGDWPPGRATYYILKTTERKRKIKRRKARLIIGGQYGVPSNVKRGPISVHSGENRCVNTELPRHPVNPESGPLLPPFPPPWKSPLILPLEGPRGGGNGGRRSAALSDRAPSSSSSSSAETPVRASRRVDTKIPPGAPAA